MKRLLATTVAAGATIAALAGCSSSASEDAASTADATSVGGMATCDDATLRADTEALLTSQDDGSNLYSFDDLECADGWAVAFPTIGPTEDEAYTYTQVFQAEGQFWVPVTDRTTVCGTRDAEDSAAYPSDAQVPESIWQSACNTN